MPDALREIVPKILARTSARALKVKLGRPAGIDADMASFEAAREAAATPVQWCIGAKGGWTPESARAMIPWLEDRGVEFVEQPLPLGLEYEFPRLRGKSSLSGGPAST